MQAMEDVDTLAADDSNGNNCTEIKDPPPAPYNDSCEFVKEECDDKYELFNYLKFAVCDLGKVRI